MTWIGLAAIVLFLVVLAATVLRPVIDRRDGPERDPTPVIQPTTTQAGP
jgi:hypothetical protein